MEPTNATGIKAWQWIVTAIVVIVLIVLGIWVFGGKSSTPAPADQAPATASDSTDQPSATNRIIIADQYPGNVVYISTVQLSKAGWVAIYTNTAGRLGDVIGETYFSSGINPGKVNLTKPMIDGGSYFAVLLSDNGDKKFDLKTDLPITDENGNVVMRPFRALSTMNSEVKG